MWNSPFDVPKHLCVSQELPKVNVEHVATALQHDVVIVAVTDSQDVGGHAAAGAGVDEVLHCLKAHQHETPRAPLRQVDRATTHLVILLLCRVVLLQPVSQRSVFEGTCDSVFYLDLPQSVSVRNHFHHP